MFFQTTNDYKNKLMCLLVERLSTVYKKPFSWKFSATFHRKGMVDGVKGHEGVCSH